MSKSARGAALVVGGSDAERNRWAEALPDHVTPVTVADGTEALAQLEPETEVLLVHRDLPDRDAPALVTEARERGATFRAALLSPEAPETDVVAEGFDAWLLVPVEPDLLTRTVEGLLACRRYDRAIGELYDLASERAAAGDDRLGAHERLGTARAEADAALEAIETIDRRALLANSPAAFRDRSP
ncbi:hypothetical protein [Haloglomus litoreum]|uniref:hypothetical protein n=1 Tax=Haloglomus litoreum TaxID=3034026 RepID=UPI0023E7CA9E|nr:hypothetical protein [Haloglomus sp. DT116]